MAKFWKKNVERKNENFGNKIFNYGYMWGLPWG